MTNRKILIIAISAIVLFAAVVGFLITLDVSPQIAFARLFIDVGLAIALVAVLMALYKEKTVITGNLIHALESLKEGQYGVKLSIDHADVLADVGVAINHLAVELSRQRSRQEAIKRDLRKELLPDFKEKIAEKIADKDEITIIDHSMHPELGPVKNLPIDETPPQNSVAPASVVATPSSDSHISLRPGEKLQNTLAISNPPEQAPPALVKIVEDTQDLGELYQSFIDAQRAINVHQVEYAEFLTTIEKTKSALLSAYLCRDVRFAVVKESGQVALQPRLIR